MCGHVDTKRRETRQTDRQTDNLVERQNTSVCQSAEGELAEASGRPISTYSEPWPWP